MDPLLLDLPHEFETERMIVRCAMPGDGPGIKSDICFSILERFRADGIVMPYPHRYIQIEGLADEEAAEDEAAPEPESPAPEPKAPKKPKAR